MCYDDQATPPIPSEATGKAHGELGFYGEADQGIPVSAINELDARLAQAGVAHRLNIYPGAPHSFFDRRAEEYADASADAWKQLLVFIHTGKL